MYRIQSKYDLISHMVITGIHYSKHYRNTVRLKRDEVIRRFSDIFSYFRF